MLFADESVEFANAAVEVMYGEGETAAAVAEGTGPEGWSLFVYQRTAQKLVCAHFISLYLSGQRGYQNWRLYDGDPSLIASLVSPNMHDGAELG